MYKEKIDLIRSTIKDACIGLDVIVGFPNECPDEFLKTFNFIESLEIFDP